jgi:hypothetical protein
MLPPSGLRPELSAARRALDGVRPPGSTGGRFLSVAPCRPRRRLDAPSRFAAPNRCELGAFPATPLSSAGALSGSGSSGNSASSGSAAAAGGAGGRGRGDAPEGFAAARPLAEELPAGFAGTAARAEGEPAGAGPRPEVLAGAAAGTCLWDGRVSEPDGAAAGTCF